MVSEKHQIVQYVLRIKEFDQKSGINKNAKATDRLLASGIIHALSFNTFFGEIVESVHVLLKFVHRDNVDAFWETFYSQMKHK